MVGHPPGCYILHEDHKIIQVEMDLRRSLSPISGLKQGQPRLLRLYPVRSGKPPRSDCTTLLAKLCLCLTGSSFSSYPVSTSPVLLMPVVSPSLTVHHREDLGSVVLTTSLYALLGPREAINSPGWMSQAPSIFPHKPLWNHLWLTCTVTFPHGCVFTKLIL